MAVDRYYPVFLAFFIFAEFTIFTIGDVTEIIYGRVNWNITLKPNIKGVPHEILWKYYEDKLVEYDGSKTVEYRQFHGRTILNLTTGDLTIKDLTKEDTGRYKAEPQIDGILQYSYYDVRVIESVTTPAVSCGRNDTTATLHCNAEGPLIEYSWEGPDNMKVPWSNHPDGPQIRREQNSDSDYICVVKNPVSESRSQAFPTKDCFPDSSPVITILVSVLAVVVVAALLGAIIYYRKKGVEQINRIEQIDRLQPSAKEDENVPTTVIIPGNVRKRVQDLETQLLAEAGGQADFHQKPNINQKKKGRRCDNHENEFLVFKDIGPSDGSPGKPIPYNTELTPLLHQKDDGSVGEVIENPTSSESRPANDSELTGEEKHSNEDHAQHTELGDEKEKVKGDRKEAVKQEDQSEAEKGEGENRRLECPVEKGEQESPGKPSIPESQENPEEWEGKGKDWTKRRVQEAGKTDKVLGEAGRQDEREKSGIQDTTTQSGQNDPANITTQNGQNDPADTTTQSGQNDPADTTTQSGQNDSDNTTTQNGPNDPAYTTTQNGQNDPANTTTQSGLTDSDNTTTQSGLTDSDNTTTQNGQNDPADTTTQSGLTDSDNTTTQNGQNDPANTTTQSGLTDPVTTTLTHLGDSV